MVFKMTPVLVQQAIDAALRYKTLVQGSSDARKPDMAYSWIRSDDADEPPVFVATLVPHPKPTHPDDKQAMHLFRRFESVRSTSKGAVTGFKVVARAAGASTVHKADLVTLCGSAFHVNELHQMLRHAEDYSTQSPEAFAELAAVKAFVAKQRAASAY
jgi:hypothetical protein